MKAMLLATALFLSCAAHAQITQIPSPVEPSNLVLINDGVVKILVMEEGVNLFSLYNLDNTLYKSVIRPVGISFQSFTGILYVTETLFDCDSTTLEYGLNHVVGNPSDGYDLWARIMREDGSEVLFLDGYTFYEGNSNFSLSNIKSIIDTDQGAVMRVTDGLFQDTMPSAYYQLCGNIPKP